MSPNRKRRNVTEEDEEDEEEEEELLGQTNKDLLNCFRNYSKVDFNMWDF